MKVQPAGGTGADAQRKQGGDNVFVLIYEHVVVGIAADNAHLRTAVFLGNVKHPTLPKHGKAARRLK